MNLALFDFDGTITTREMFADFIHFAVPRPRLLLGKLLLAPLVVGYKLGWVSGHLMRASALRVGLGGVAQERASELGARFAAEVLGGVLRDNAMARIAWHKQRGDRVVVVSGAFDTYLAHWCRQHDLELVCSRLETRDGVLTGRYLGEQCVGPEKERRVRAAYALADYPVIYAYGDTRDDFDLLRLAIDPRAPDTDAAQATA